MFGLFSTLFSNFMNLAGQGAQYAQSKELAELQNQFNIDMWNRNNEYNTPQAQMKRFSEAGLNPNLIYGMGSPGNSSSPPQKVVPQAPDWAKGMSEAAKSFNIEQLKTLRANRKKAEEEAKQSHLDTQNKAEERDAIRDLGFLYSFDPKTGRFVSDINPIETTASGEGSTRGGRLLRYVADNYIRTSLIPAREGLLEQQRQYLVPQVQMARYDQQYYPISYWIDRGARAAHGVSDLVGIFNPTKWMKPTKFKQAPYQYKNPYKTPYVQPDYTELPF